MDSLKNDYRVLILSASERFGTFLAPILAAHGIDSVSTVNTQRAARQSIADERYDFIFVNSPLPDSDGYRFATDASRTLGSVVLVALPAECYEAASGELAPHGVYLLQKPISQKALSAAMDWMFATRARLYEVEERRISLEEKMKELTLVNRAKWVLIDRCGMSETEAHHYIEKQAMDRRISKREAAESIVRDGE